MRKRKNGLRLVTKVRARLRRLRLVVEGVPYGA